MVTGPWETPAPAPPLLRETRSAPKAAPIPARTAPSLPLGGLSTRDTSLEPGRNLVGYAVFNFTTRAWTRESSGPYFSDGTLHGATATFAPIFGFNGLIFGLGGQSNFRDYDQDYVTFQRVHFLDPGCDWRGTFGSLLSLFCWYCQHFRNVSSKLTGALHCVGF